MTASTKQIDAILDSLVELCCDSLREEEPLDQKRLHALVESLSMNGWDRHAGDHEPLGVLVEKRVLERCRDDSMHHPEEPEALGRQIQKAYKDYQRYRTSVPDEDRSPSKQQGSQASSPRTTLNSFPPE